jgi:glycosyltransferase 2 family protein
VIAKRWRLWLRSAQVAVTGGLIGWLLKQIDWAQIMPLFARLDWGWVVLSVVFVLISHLINVARWRYILHQRVVGYGELLMIYGAGLFSNNFLPTGVGGDGVRAGLLSRTISLAWAIVSVGADRGIALVALSAYVVPGLWLGLPLGHTLDQGRLFEGVASRSAALTALCLGAASLMSLALWRLPKLRGYLARLRGDSLWTDINWGWILSGGFLFSIASHASLIVAYWLVFRSVHVIVPPGAALWLYLVGSISLLLPISVNGLGLQEGIAVALLANYQVPATDALGVALIIRGLIVLFSLLGGLLSLGMAHPRRIGRDTVGS